MKKIFLFACAVFIMLSASAQSKVYMTRDITPEALVKLYKALGRPADGHRVAVKSVPAKPAIPTTLSRLL